MQQNISHAHSQGAAVNKSMVSSNQALWQHPYVDVFKHFKVVAPGADWKSNKKQGQVEETFVKEIGRNVLNIQGSISANNYIQIPHPHSMTKSLGLTGRYLYLECRSMSEKNQFNFHFDLSMAERSHNVRISVSNLFKQFNSTQGFVMQVPLTLQHHKWTIVCLDLYQLLDRSKMFPPTYSIEGSYQFKSISACANMQLRGIYTSDNLYDFVTLPQDMKYKFSFELQRWLEFFDWQSLPTDWDTMDVNDSQFQSADQAKMIQQSKRQQKIEVNKDQERANMKNEIDQLFDIKNQQVDSQDTETKKQIQKAKFDAIQKEMEKAYNSGSESKDKITGYLGKSGQAEDDSTVEKLQRPTSKQVKGILHQNPAAASAKDTYVSGQYNNVELKRSFKLNKDPILELQHIIGYSADKCLNLKWSRYHNESAVIFTSGATLISMDIENNQQKKFFFGHSSAICCFDLNHNGTVLASAQEGKNSIIRVWEYETARCLSMMTMPVTSLKCLAFSHDGRFLASCGKDSHNKEMIIIWDLTKISKGEKPEIVARQTSDFNILCLKFSPIDSTRLCSCGKENIRFWRIKETGNIRGSAVVLNHHARNTVFTSLDFEYGFRSADMRENEALKRLFVASKHGMVFQINYQTESLEATYQTNDSAIYSISVNEAFCVTGSEDTYLRVWPLDFSEFFMEAKHEGTVNAVDISADGLKVVCGTQYGSLGILDKSNQRYRTLLRSHTSDILQMDFHVAKKNIITVSRDRTIRLWDVLNFDQVYEFSSPIDQPLCVSAHNQLPIFSCGFESGVMRVFDIEKTCVADEFSQFNKPLQKISYSPAGDLLVTCCQDGSVAIHNARRQHLPMKMLHLEFVPEFVHVAFSKSTHGILSNQSQEFSAEFTDLNDSQSLTFQDAMFALMGENGNNVVIYDSNSFVLKHQIQANAILTQFMFANGNRDILCLTKDSRIRFFSLAKYEGVFLRELSTVHRGLIQSINVSNNSGYFLTGGDDNMIKVWDYEAQKTAPYYFQTFIGHNYPINSIMFNPTNPEQVISVGANDGIFIWNFTGDNETNFAFTNQPEIGVTQAPLRLSKEPGMLEKMRQTYKKEKSKHSLAENSFIVPKFMPLETNRKQDEEVTEPEGYCDKVEKVRRERQLTYNHYAGCSKAFDLEQEQEALIKTSSSDEILPVRLINGYDGYGGVHDNLIWNANSGWICYTLNNKVIFENTKMRSQSIIADSMVQLSCLAATKDYKMIAACEGSANKNGQSLIYLYMSDTKNLINKLVFHQRGIQAAAFSPCSQYLITIGVQGENALAIWDVTQGIVLKSALFDNYATNQIQFDPYVQDGNLQFCTCGNQGSMSLWRLDTEQMQLGYVDVDVPSEIAPTDFTSIAYSQFIQQQGTFLIILGGSDGSICAYHPVDRKFINFNKKSYVVNGQIGNIIYKNQTILLATSTGSIARYSVKHGNIFSDDRDAIDALNVDGGVTSIQTDDYNYEAIVGTANGSIYYLNFQERLEIQLISKVNCNQERINEIKYDLQNPNAFLSQCHVESAQVKMFTTQTLDQICRFQGKPYSNVIFMLQAKNNKKMKIIGYTNGQLRFLNQDHLTMDTMIQCPLEPEEEITCGTFAPNNINFVIGTTLGNVRMGSFKTSKRGFPMVSLTHNIDNVNKTESYAVTSISFSPFNPIGSLSVCFDNGVIKTWQTSPKNEQVLKLIEVQIQQHKRAGKKENTYNFDLADGGYCQYDLIDTFDMFENPHGLKDQSEEDKQQLQDLYRNKSYKECQAIFAPGNTSAEIYFCYVSALQYIYVRNFVKNQVLKTVSLMHFPTCISVLDFSKLDIQVETQFKGGQQTLLAVGTKESRVLVFKVDTMGYEKLLQTKSGYSYGGITAVDMTQSAEKLIAANETGEVLTFDLLDKINEKAQN